MEPQQNAFRGILTKSTGISEADRIQRWYYDPIEEQGEHRGITILLLIVPVYERYLRHACNYEGGFGLNTCPIQQIANQFAISEEQAYHFWQIMRNGLLHRSAPKEMVGLKQYVLTSTGEAVSDPHIGQLVINPYAVREILLPLFKNNPSFWSHTGYPVPDKVTPIYASEQTSQSYTQTQPHTP